MKKAIQVQKDIKLKVGEILDQNRSSKIFLGGQTAPVEKGGGRACSGFNGPLVRPFDTLDSYNKIIAN